MTKNLVSYTLKLMLKFFNKQQINLYLLNVTSAQNNSSRL